MKTMNKKQIASAWAKEYLEFNYPLRAPSFEPESFEDYITGDETKEKLLEAIHDYMSELDTERAEAIAQRNDF